MCDYSLHHIKSRKAAIGDKLVTKKYNHGTTGFADANDEDTVVCMMPGTELSFAKPIEYVTSSWDTESVRINAHVATFRQTNLDVVSTHHDQIETVYGDKILVTYLVEGQCAEVLQLPAEPAEPRPAVEHSVAREPTLDELFIG
jgi:hypothetical protein